MNQPNQIKKNNNPFKKRFLLTIFILVVIGLVVAGVIANGLFSKNSIPSDYRLSIEKGQGISTVANRLEKDNIINNQFYFVLATYLNSDFKHMKVGKYKLPQQASVWDILTHLNQKRPDTTSVQIIEGTRFAQMRKIINENPDLTHETENWSDQELLAKIDPNNTQQYPSLEGLFYPDTYEADEGSSDLKIYQAAYKAMQKNLNQAWESRQADLPYQSPYELLTMASIIEKETAHLDDQRDVAAVFKNRLKIGMRLQTDPTVIYGMGDAYQGKIRRADLERDTPYNTYTREGLTPTPIALPSGSALKAAANPSDAKYLYFVAKLDGSGRSQFSHNLEEHNDAVRKYILKK